LSIVVYLLTVTLTVNISFTRQTYMRTTKVPKKTIQVSVQTRRW